jgi:hypothetical protein
MNIEKFKSGGCGSIEDAFLLAGARSIVYPLWTAKKIVS